MPASPLGSYSDLKILQNQLLGFTLECKHSIAMVKSIKHFIFLQFQVSSRSSAEYSGFI